MLAVATTGCLQVWQSVAKHLLSGFYGVKLHLIININHKEEIIAVHITALIRVMSALRFGLR